MSGRENAALSDFGSSLWFDATALNACRSWIGSGAFGDAYVTADYFTAHQRRIHSYSLVAHEGGLHV